MKALSFGLFMDTNLFTYGRGERGDRELQEKRKVNRKGRFEKKNA